MSSQGRVAMPPFTCYPRLWANPTGLVLCRAYSASEVGRGGVCIYIYIYVHIYICRHWFMYIYIYVYIYFKSFIFSFMYILLIEYAKDEEDCNYYVGGVFGLDDACRSRGP